MIIINLDKAKTIAHEVRRQARAKEFQPFDEQIMKQIPGSDFVALEAERQAVREKYSAIQDEIETATDIEGLKSIVVQIIPGG